MTTSTALDQNFATNVFYGMKVGTVPLGESLDTGAWTYWDGSQWVAGESNVCPSRHRFGAHRRHLPRERKRVHGYLNSRAAS